MNFDRIRDTLDVDRLQSTHLVAVGGCMHLAADFVRCGLGSMTLLDFDTVSPTNPARQDYQSDEIGQSKVAVYESFLRRINPDVQVRTYRRDVNSLNADDLRRIFGHASLIIGATDSFPAQARLNQISQSMGIPFLAIGLYAMGLGGEVVFSSPGLTRSCARCLWRSRYEAFRQSPAITQASSQGGTIMDLHLVDAVAGQIALGLLTRGSNNRYGRLVDRLGQRNLLLIRNSPELRLGDVDPFTRYLGDHPANISYSTIALEIDPDPACPDCALGRGATTKRRSSSSASQGPGPKAIVGVGGEMGDVRDVGEEVASS